MQLALDNPSVRFPLVALLVLAMLIPLTFVAGVGAERQRYYQQVFGEIAQGWGQSQVVTGPFIVVPEVVRYQIKNQAGEVVWHALHQQRVWLPEALTIDAEVNHQYRHKSIYEVPVYESVAFLQGQFAQPDFVDPAGRTVERDWNSARLVLGVSHAQAIAELGEVSLNGQAARFSPLNQQAGLPAGIEVPLAGLNAAAGLTFEFKVRLRGSSSLGFEPLGGNSQVNMQSSWPHPDFGGRYLPNQYSVSDSGFEAQWQIHELARSLPGNFLLQTDAMAFYNDQASVSLHQPVTTYTVVDRGIKYGLLFIGLTFLTFVCFELMTSIRFHFVQYAVVGAGLVLFYQTLLSLSEHLPFLAAYVISTALLGSLITGYVWAMTRRRPLTLWAGSVLLILYLCLYSLLQLESYALLVGTFLLIIGLIALMYATRTLTDHTP